MKVPSKGGVTNQTLDRGLRALAHIAEAPAPPTIDQLAAHLDIHRSMAYRIVRTLEDHGLTERDEQGECHPASRLTDLARGVRFSLHKVARPELEALAAQLGLTAFLVVPVGGDAVTIDAAEPTQVDTVVSYRPGTRHPLADGAPGIALLAGQPALADERAEVAEARSRGWAQSSGEVIEGLGSIATWVKGPGGESVAAIACLFLGQTPPDEDDAASCLQQSARKISQALLPA
ncbi:MAG: IclR family transcriptional regulator [Acidimicrobiales bacterium]